jgi:hypothetical protein
VDKPADGLRKLAADWRCIDLFRLNNAVFAIAPARRASRPAARRSVANTQPVSWLHRDDALQVGFRTRALVSRSVVGAMLA